MSFLIFFSKYIINFVFFIKSNNIFQLDFVKYVKNLWNLIKISNKNSITDNKTFGRKLRFLVHSGGTNFSENIFWHIWDTFVHSLVENSRSLIIIILKTINELRRISNICTMDEFFKKRLVGKFSKPAISDRGGVP
jgi:hypothetical protein